MSELMDRSNLILPGLEPPVQILPQQQAPRLYSSTSGSTILSSHFQPCQRVCQRVCQHASHTIRHRQQQNGRSCVKHFSSSCHGDVRALKQERPLSKEKFKDAFILYPTSEPKRTFDAQFFNRLFDDSQRPPENYPSLGVAPLLLLYASRELEQIQTPDFEKEVSVQIIQDSLQMPIYRVQNTGVERELVVGKLLEKQTLGEPRHWIASKGEYLDTVEAGIIDAVKEMKTALTDAASGRRQQTTPRAPESCHKMTRNVLRMDVRSTSAWRKAGLKLMRHVRLQSYASYGTRDWSQHTAPGNGSRHMPSAGTTSEAISVLKNRQQQGIPADSYTYVKVLQMCLKQKDLSAAKQLHNCIIETGMDKNPYVARTLLNVYIKCGGLLDARRVFDELEQKTVITWNMMISGYAKSDDAKSAVELFNLMRQEGVRSDQVTYLCILKACANPLALQSGKEVHECIRHDGFELDVRVGTALLQMYAKCGCLVEARQVFDRMQKRDLVIWTTMLGVLAQYGRGQEAYELFLQMRREGFEPDIVTWTALIGGLAQHGCGREAYRLFLQMKQEGFEPNAITYLSILNACASGGALEWVKEVHGHAREAGLESDLRVGAALVHMYAESGSIDDARLVFDRMEKRDVVTWNIMLGGLAQHGCGHEALELFRKMTAELVKPDGSTFVALLSACCHGGLLGEGRRLFSSMTKDYAVEPDILHYTCMVDLLGRAGHLEEAKLFISDMPIEPNAVTWKALLGACRTYGNLELGELAAKELFKLEPNHASGYVLLSNIYAAAGKWEKVSLVRTMMQERCVRKAPGCSWIEVDNKIHEFVVGDTSHPEAKAIYTELNKLTEKLKAEGYIPDTRLVLHEINEEDKELALCSHSEKLAITYGLMHIPQEEPIRISKNLRVCPDCHTATKLISKVTGREIIARDANRFHHFKDGMCSCGDYW